MIIKWSKVQVNDIMAFLYILYNTREPCACPRAGPKKMACARARPRARPRTSVATALLINEINETHSNQGGKQNRKHNATTNWTNWREQNVGENAKKKKNEGGRVEEKKEENKGGQVMVPWTKDTKEDDRSSIGTERSPQDVQTF